MSKDIQDREDIKQLVHAFYEKLLQDDEFKYLFLDVAEIDVLAHFDIIIDFWESVLFQAGKYKHDLIDIHLNLNQKYHYGLKEKHFQKWLHLFNSVVDELYKGEIAGEAKNKALSIATIIRMKIENLEQMRLKFNN